MLEALEAEEDNSDFEEEQYPQLPEQPDSEHFWATIEHDPAYWAQYLGARPVYDDEHYAALFDYHATHGDPSWDLAHDLGTGPGQVAEVLASRFSRVIATDNNLKHLFEARHRLGRTLGMLRKVELAQIAAEDIGDRYPDEQADMIVAAECLPLIDDKRGMPAWKQILKPGGTLAIWFYGRLAFANPDVSDRCTPILADIVDYCYRRAILPVGPAAMAGWKRATVRLDSWLDDVELPPEDWEHVQRYKWNTDKMLNFYGSASHDFRIEKISNIHPAEKVMVGTDRDKWAKMMNCEDIKQFVLALLPNMNLLIENKHCQIRFEELEEAMGGKMARQKICWPVVLILATKKAKDEQAS